MIWEYFKEFDEILASVELTPEEMVVAEKIRNFYDSLRVYMRRDNMADAFGVGDVSGLIEYHTFEETLADFKGWLNWEKERYEKFKEEEHE